MAESKKEEKYPDEEIDKLIVKLGQEVVIKSKFTYKFPSFPAKWKEAFVGAKPYLKQAQIEVNKIMKNFHPAVTYPASEDLFNVFRYTPPDKVRIVILGQDPYHNGAAMGLAFSSKPKAKPEASLRNIFAEIKNDYPEYKIPKDGYLKHWADQGIFLLNTSLTVQKGIADSHKEIWTGFTKYIIEYISQKNKKCIFVLWGNKAQKFESCIKSTQAYIITGAHPSPFSYRLFKDKKFFLKIDAILERELKQEKIQW